MRPWRSCPAGAKKQRTRFSPWRSSREARKPNFAHSLARRICSMNAAEAANFSRGDQLKKTMEFVRDFSFTHGLFGQGATSKDYVGIQFPDGTIMGDKNNVKLRFDATYMQMAADKKL